MQEKVLRIDEAVGLIEDGDSVAIGGVGRNRVPMALVREIVRQGKRDLSLIGREVGIDFDILIGAGLVREVTAAYVGLEEFGLALNFRRAVESGRVEMNEQTCGSIISSLRAGAMGLPFLPMKGLWGSDLLRVHDDFKPIECPFSGEKLVAMPAINPDVALIHAQRGDAYGNIQLKGSRFEDALMVRAARKAIVSVEEIIPHEKIKKDPEATTIPYFLVKAAVETPQGAHPTSCYQYYGSDREHIGLYARSTRSEEDFAEYLARFVYNLKDHKEYQQLISRKEKSHG